MEKPKTYKNAGLFGADGLQAKVTIDVPDHVYLKIFGVIVLGAFAGTAGGILISRLLKPKQ